LGHGERGLPPAERSALRDELGAAPAPHGAAHAPAGHIDVFA
jgi:hypothetical protein